MDRDRDMARRIARQVAREGGRVYYVGGLVRDEILGIAGKDVDIEVHGIPPRRLEEILDSLGIRLSMGASFGILGLKGYGLDISMPRRVGANGGEDGFAAGVDPFVGVAEAARRRDFTMNAMMRDVLTGELKDPFNGMRDLSEGVIRHVDAATFALDPLRVLRAAQFAARFSFTVAPETREICRSLSIDGLPFERVGEELRKALVRAPAPSVFFREAEAMRHLVPWFAEIAGEGGGECLRLLDAAAGLRGRALNGEDLMFAALVQYLPEDRAAALLSRVTRRERTLAFAADMRRLGAPAEELALRRAGRDDWAMLLDASLCPEDLCLMVKARLSLRGEGAENADTDELIDTRLREYRYLVSLPAVTGQDLARRGVPPGPGMGRALKYARELLLRGVPKEEALEETLRRAR